MMKFLSHVNAHERVAPAGDGFNNEVTRITYSKIPISFFPQLLVSFSNWLMNKMTVVEGMEAMHGLSAFTSTHQG